MWAFTDYPESEEFSGVNYHWAEDPVVSLNHHI